MSVALHRVQDLGRECEKLRVKAELRGEVETYLEFRDTQNDAVEDGETALAAEIGRCMVALRTKHEARIWNRELERQIAAQR